MSVLALDRLWGTTEWGRVYGRMQWTSHPQTLETRPLFNGLGLRTGRDGEGVVVPVDSRTGGSGAIRGERDRNASAVGAAGGEGGVGPAEAREGSGAGTGVGGRGRLGTMTTTTTASLRLPRSTWV